MKPFRSCWPRSNTLERGWPVREIFGGDSWNGTSIPRRWTPCQRINLQPDHQQPWSMAAGPGRTFARRIAGAPRRGALRSQNCSLSPAVGGGSVPARNFQVRLCECPATRRHGGSRCSLGPRTTWRSACTGSARRGALALEHGQVVRRAPDRGEELPGWGAAAGRPSLGQRPRDLWLRDPER